MSVHRFPNPDGGFAEAIAEMTRTPLRPEVTWSEIPAPGRMAPHSWAANAEVELHGEELASGRLVVLHDPAGQESWQGAYRFVALVQAQLEPEFAVESMLGDVAWSWVTESLELHDASARELGCTATRVVSNSYGALAERPSTVDVEMRVSWTPEPPAPGSGPPAPELGPHLAAWADMLAAAGGLPPAPPQVATIAPAHRARAPRPGADA